MIRDEVSPRDTGSDAVKTKWTVFEVMNDVRAVFGRAGRSECAIGVGNVGMVRAQAFRS